MIRIHVARIAALDPLPWFASLDGGDRFYWESAEAGLALAAGGAAVVVEESGPERFARLRDRLRAECVERAGEGDPGAPLPLWLGGFAFSPEPPGGVWDGFAALRWVVPRRLVLARGDETWLAVAAREPCSPGELAGEARRFAEALRKHAADAHLPAHAGGTATPHCATGAPIERLRTHPDAARAYEERVRAARRAVREGRLEKVVVARATHGRAPAFAPRAWLEALRVHREDARLFAVGHDARLFFGATPERLVAVRDGRVAVDALAGSAPRGACAEADVRLARELLESKKEQEEHAVVVRALRAALATHCDDLRMPEAPRLRRLRDVQHLHTPLRARLRSGAAFRAIDLVAALHPTPAVAGAPRDAALEWIERHEGLERGWYAGGVGWLDARGEGEIAVGLRSALWLAGEVTLFAGAGVLADSDPEREAREAELKLRPVARALGMREP